MVAAAIGMSLVAGRHRRRGTRTIAAAAVDAYPGRAARPGALVKNCPLAQRAGICRNPATSGRVRLCPW
jgi:hypothetical protein